MVMYASGAGSSFEEDLGSNTLDACGCYGGGGGYCGDDVRWMCFFIYKCGVEEPIFSPMITVRNAAGRGIT